MDGVPKCNLGGGHVLQIQFRGPEYHVLQSGAIGGPNRWEKKRCLSAPDPMQCFFPFSFFFFRLVSPLRHMVSELVQSPLSTYTNDVTPRGVQVRASANRSGKLIGDDLPRSSIVDLLGS
jgi:hypothetical protein